MENKSISKEKIISLISEGIANANGKPSMIKNIREEDFLNIGKLCVERGLEKKFLKHITNVELGPCSIVSNLINVQDTYSDIPDLRDYPQAKDCLDEKQFKHKQSLPVKVFETLSGKDGDDSRIFKSFKRPLKDIAMDQNRIIQFILDHPDLLSIDGDTLFLVDNKDEHPNAARFFFITLGKIKNTGEKYLDYDSYGDSRATPLVGKEKHRIIICA
jgi:hypothetical protein